MFIVTLPSNWSKEKGGIAVPQGGIAVSQFKTERKLQN